MELLRYLKDYRKRLEYIHEELDKKQERIESAMDFIDMSDKIIESVIRNDKAIMRDPCLERLVEKNCGEIGKDLYILASKHYDSISLFRDKFLSYLKSCTTDSSVGKRAGDMNG